MPMLPDNRAEKDALLAAEQAAQRRRTRRIRIGSGLLGIALVGLAPVVVPRLLHEAPPAQPPLAVAKPPGIPPEVDVTQVGRPDPAILARYIAQHIAAGNPEAASFIISDAERMTGCDVRAGQATVDKGDRARTRVMTEVKRTMRELEAEPGVEAGYAKASSPVDRSVLVYAVAAVRCDGGQVDP